jgi:hypothetical protein
MSSRFRTRWYPVASGAAATLLFILFSAMTIANFVALIEAHAS